MKTRSLLVWFPGNPFDPRMLLPSCRLATVAACLLEEGHQTQVQDYGSVDLIARLFSGDAWEPIRRRAESFSPASVGNPLLALRRVWETRSLERAFWGRLDAVCREAAEEQASRGDLDFVAFEVTGPSDWRPAAVMAEILKARCPNLKTLAFGRVVESLWNVPKRMMHGFDALCVGDPESAVVEWAERLERRSEWERIPNLASGLGGDPQPVRRRSTTNLGLLPAPAYTDDVYPSLRGDQKAKLFELEESRGCSERCYGCSEAALDRPLRIKSPQRIRNEMAGLAERHGAQAFRLSGSHSTWEQVCGTAQAILGSGLRAVYSRKGPIQWAMEKTFPFLEASGCAAMTFRVESGSQRLLDDHYGRGLGISHVERVFRACKGAGIHLGVEMTYPCPEDDHHTMDETLRLLSRTKPDCVRVGLPEVAARTAWHVRSSEFGYRVKPGRQPWRHIESGGGPNADLGGWRTPSVGIGGLSTTQVIRAHEELLLAIEGEGGLTCFPEEVAVLARFTGYGGREGELAGLIRHQLLTGDSEALGGLVAGFNKEACVPARVGAFVPFTPVPLAVGN